MTDPTARTVGEWVLQQRIGSGSFAVVWKASHKITGRIAAIKEISTDRLNKKLKQSLESEVSILKQIRHKNIVHLEDVIEAANYLYLVMEYCAGGDLANYIRRCKRVPEVTACAVMRQLGAGLKELYTRHMVHRDLKPQNLLLSDNTPHAVLKIADFGFARHLQQQELADTLCGSPLYMAPEILQSHKYDAKADLWSVGTILYELVVSKPPFNGINHVELLRNIERREAKVPDQVAKGLSPACTDLIYGLLKRMPVQRMSFEEFFAHPFLAGTVPLAATVHAEAPGPESQPAVSGEGKPVQRLAGQAANGPNDSLPFVLDDDAVAVAYQQPLQQQPTVLQEPAQAAPLLQRPSYGHRSPATAAAARQLVHTASSSRPPLAASPKSGAWQPQKSPPYNLGLADSHVLVPGTPPLQPASLPVASHGGSTAQVQGRTVATHPLQARQGSSSIGSSIEDEGFVIVNAPPPFSTSHQPSTRRFGRGGYNILTRLRSEPLPSPQPNPSPSNPSPTTSPSPIRQQQQQQMPSPLSPVPQSVRPWLQVPAPPQHAAQQHSMPEHAVSTSEEPNSQYSQAPVRAGQPHNALRAGQASGAAVATALPSQGTLGTDRQKQVLELGLEPDMSSPQALAQLGAMLEDVASGAEDKQQPQEALSLRLLAMQLLLLALGKGTLGTSSQHTMASAAQPHQTPQTEGHSVDRSQSPAQHTADSGSHARSSAAAMQHQQEQQQQQPQENADDSSQQQEHVHMVLGVQQGTGAVTNLSMKDLRQRLLDIAARADENALAVKQEDAVTNVPYVWQLVYAAGLEYAREGAMQEIIGQFLACAQPYYQGMQILVFLHSVASTLGFLPPLVLAEADRQRLKLLSQQLRRRIAVCKSALKTA